MENNQYVGLEDQNSGSGTETTFCEANSCTF
jgi:hypothetical protein